MAKINKSKIPIWAEIADAEIHCIGYPLLECKECGYVWLPRIQKGETQEDLPESCTNCKRELDYGDDMEEFYIPEEPPR